jgi:hypothetical protein
MCYLYGLFETNKFAVNVVRLPFFLPSFGPVRIMVRPLFANVIWTIFIGYWHANNQQAMLLSNKFMVVKNAKRSYQNDTDKWLAEDLKDGKHITNISTVENPSEL